MTALWTRFVPVASVAAAALLFAACGDERDPSRPMTEGEQIALASGCTACHGSNGEGGVGPGWQGLYQSEITLADDSTVVADEAFLFESIRDPAAKSRKNYGAMPANALNDAEVQAIVDFIITLK